MSEGGKEYYKPVSKVINSKSAPIRGDADMDGIVTVIDVSTIQQNLAGLNPENYNEKAADCDGDGKVTIIDATIIQQHLAKLPIEYNVGEPIV